MKVKIKRVQKVLQQLKLQPLEPIEKVIADKTKKSYSGLVLDEKKRQLFLKVRVSHDLKQKESFYQSYSLGNVLNRYHPTLYRLTPRLIDAKLSSDTNFLLYQFIEGENMGSRIFHDVFKFKKEDVGQILTIHRAICELPSHWFGQKFKRRKSDFFHFLIFKDVPWDEKKLLTVYRQEELKKIKNLLEDKKLKNLLDKESRTFQHGDFQPPNFIKNKNGRLFIVDFDQCCLTNPFYDLAYFYNHAFRKPWLRSKVMHSLIEQDKLSDAQKLLFYFMRFVNTFVWVKLYLKKERWYKLRKLKDFNIRKKAFLYRLADSKAILNQVVARSKK